MKWVLVVLVIGSGVINADEYDTRAQCEAALRKMEKVFHVKPELRVAMFCVRGSMVVDEKSAGRHES